MTKEFWVDLWAGWIAGAASVLAVQPLDTTLTRMQATRLAPGVDGSASAALRVVLAEGGARALWRGAAPMTAVIPAQNALLFAGYGVGERWASRGGSSSDASSKTSSSLLPVFCGGVVGGVLQSFVVSPFELVKIRQQSAGGTATLAVSTLAGTLGRAGLATRGLGATLLRDGVPHGAWFAAYEWSKRRMIRDDENDGLSATTSGGLTDAWVPLCAGAFAAAVAWGVGYPADLVKTRVQAHAARSAAAATLAPGLAETCAAMLRESGGDVLRAFYRGFDLKLLRAVPASAVSFFAYEEARRWLERE
uniref:Mitochondrial carrier family n=1 Tax=Micromonas pusilla TaxID=38833 RepID=A0A7S0I9L0_MICPS|mmetsp:Transcript_12910/g.54661  ORF Transcript_12910/g.54661 Transcript_12910/m.54661 type:complete len:306 (+) Transcript_12910:217-1134(+)